MRNKDEEISKTFKSKKGLMIHTEVHQETIPQMDGMDLSLAESFSDESDKVIIGKPKHKKNKAGEPVIRFFWFFSFFCFSARGLVVIRFFCFS